MEKGNSVRLDNQKGSAEKVPTLQKANSQAAKILQKVDSLNENREAAMVVKDVITEAQPQGQQEIDMLKHWIEPSAEIPYEKSSSSI